MVNENDDLKDEGVEITGSAHVNPDLDKDDVLGVAPTINTELEPLDDELEGEKLDIPYVDEEDKGFI